MWKILKTFVLMVAYGLITFIGSLMFFTQLGMYNHNGYNYYLDYYPALVLGVPVIGFLFPGVVGWYLHQRGRPKSDLEGGKDQKGSGVDLRPNQHSDELP